MGERLRVRALAPLYLLLVACCSALVPVPVRAGSDYDIVVSDQTTMPVTVYVNGTIVRVVSPQAQETLPAGQLPSLPWIVEARTSRGRVLASMTVRAGDAWRQAGAWKGDATRVDLSCGRLDIWSGPPILGPSPGPGIPGDCDQ